MPIQTEAPSRKSWRDALPIHPAAELFPPMSSDELRELGADIVKKNGLVAPIALWRRNPNEPLQLLDGRNRLDAIELVTGRTVEIGAPSLMAGDFLACDKVVISTIRSILTPMPSPLISTAAILVSSSDSICSSRPSRVRRRNPTDRLPRKLASTTRRSPAREPKGKTWGAFPTSRRGPTPRVASSRRRRQRHQRIL